MLNFLAALSSAWPRHGAASFLELEADGAVAGAALQPVDHAGSAELRRWVSAIKGEGPGMRCAHRARARDPPRLKKIGLEPIFGRFGRLRRCLKVFEGFGKNASRCFGPAGEVPLQPAAGRGDVRAYGFRAAVRALRGRSRWGPG